MGGPQNRINQAAFVIQYLADISRYKEVDGSWRPMQIDTSTTWDAGVDFCDSFSEAFPGKKPDPNLKLASARLRRLMVQLVDRGVVDRGRQGNDGDDVGTPKWQYLYWLSAHLLNQLKRGEMTALRVVEELT